MRIEGQRLTADVEECLPDYEFAFEGSDGGVRGMYYRCGRTRELQAEFGDMLHRIHDMEVRAGGVPSQTPGSPEEGGRAGERQCRAWSTAILEASHRV